MLREIFKIFIAVMTGMYLLRKFLEWINEIYMGVLGWFEMNFGLFFGQSYFHVLTIILFSFILYRKISRSMYFNRMINFFHNIGIKSPHDL